MLSLGSTTSARLLQSFEMFDLRYHLASLAAVFIALAVGILLGVAISGKLSEADNAIAHDRIDQLNGQLQQANARADIIERRNLAAEQLLEIGYPALMENRLEGKNIGVLFVGAVDGSVRSAIERTLSDSGSGSPVRLVAVDTPIDAKELDGALNGDQALTQFAQGGDDFTSLGNALGRELADGDGMPMWSTLSSNLVEERSGASATPLDGVVVVRSWALPENPTAEQEAQAHPTETLLDGLLSGLQHSGIPIVGVESTSEQDSAIDLYRTQGISSVDDVDALAGRVALALLLAGGEPGHYGVKDSASDGVAPPIDSVPVPGG
jgi:Copper transport outer membrane protein, MctB